VLCKFGFVKKPNLWFLEENNAYYLYPPGKAEGAIGNHIIKAWEL